MPDLAVSNDAEIIAKVKKNSRDIDNFQSSHLWGTDSRCSVGIVSVEFVSLAV